MDNYKDFIDFGFSKGMSEAIRAAYGQSYIPNPTVGASLISNDGDILITTNHQGKNTDHAEISIIKHIVRKNIDTTGATLYVTLEPCMHSNTSPSCAKELARSKLFDKIVVGDIDPDLRTNGQGISYLTNHGIDVKLEHGATYFLDPSYISIKNQSPYPYIISKFGISKDDYIYSAKQPNDKYITSNYSRKLSHYIRGSVDAILIGKNTLITDKPKLSIRHGIKANPPAKFVLWGNSQDEFDSYLERYDDVNFITTFKSNNKRILSFDNLDSKLILLSLKKDGIDSLLVEGGLKLWLNFSDYINKLYIFESPIKLKSGLAFKRSENLKSFEIDKEIPLSEDKLYIYNTRAIN